jgi:hypothetical protein
MTMSELMALGAPALPDGLFYRIKVDPYTGQITIQIREDRKRFGSKMLESHFYYVDELTLAEMCEDTSEKYLKRTKTYRENNAKIKALAKYAGDHR